MHSDHASEAEEIRKHIPKYLMVGAALLVFTGITVSANAIHLAVPAAITLALLIATCKGTMVASIFMHLNHERKWIYGSLLLTVVLFIPLMFLPILTINDSTGRPTQEQLKAPAGHDAGHEAGAKGAKDAGAPGTKAEH
jgi:caa(3)-type oxidase subunit IV